MPAILNTAISNDDPGLGSIRDTLRRRILARALEPGIHPTALEGLTLMRADGTSRCTASVYEPCLGFIVQGQKTLEFGDREIVYGSMCYLASAVHVPVLAQISGASPDRPYLALKLVVDPQEVTDLVLQLGDKLPDGTECPELSCGIGVARMDADMVDAVNRLVGLLDTPADIPVLAPLAKREIVYRALIGEIGTRLRKFARVDSQANRISRVISLIRDRFSEPLRIAELASQANMSESSLHHSFKQVTRMSPLQFQKKLRLHEARRLMLAEGLEASSASYRVGYESPSHFSREYSRMFGAPPRADVTKLRTEQRVPA